MIKTIFSCIYSVLIVVIFTTLIVVIFTTYSFSQGSRGISGEIWGTVVESKTNKPIEYATVSLYQKNPEQLITGIITDAKGKFLLSNIKKGEYYLKITFVGFKDKIVNDIVISKDKSRYNVKELKVESSLDLKEVVVKGNTPSITYDIDKKVINVEDMETSVGQTAVEVLENTPSIQVDNEGNVTLRGSAGFTLLIDGRVTAMDANNALQSIPASTIKNIEIITNPSARQDAEGAGGIINIITKKNKLEGASLLLNGSLGSFGQNSVDLAVNYRVKKHAFNLNASYNNRNYLRSNFERRTTNFDSAQLDVLKNGVNTWKTSGYKIRGEWIYNPIPDHSLMIGSSIGRRFMNPFDRAVFTELENDSLVDEYFNDHFTDILIRTMSNYLHYTHNFNSDEKHYIKLRGVFNMRSVDEYTYTDYYKSDDKIGGFFATEFGPSNVMRFNIDYVRPLKKDVSVEFGGQAQLGLSKDEKTNYEYNPVTKENEILPLFSSDVQYQRNIYAGYSLIRGKKKKFGYQVGLRAEYTYRNIEATNFAAFQEIDRLDWFPSAHFSYNLSKDQQLLVSYSRRIERPRSYFFEPFISFNSEYSVSQGNPDLKPEYINVAEINWIKQLGNKGNISVETYGKFLTNLISRIPSVYDTNVIMELPFNVGNTTSLGMEPSISYYLKDWWNTRLSANLYYFAVDSRVLTNIGTNESFNWNTRFVNTFTIAKEWRLQVLANYNSKSVTAIGIQEESYHLNASLRRSFLKKKLALTFQVRDVFSTERNIYRSILNNVEVYKNSNPFSPKFTLTVSLRLNNYQKMYEKGNQPMDDF